jgi:hypothetical protein
MSSASSIPSSILIFITITITITITVIKTVLIAIVLFTVPPHQCACIQHPLLHHRPAFTSRPLPSPPSLSPSISVSVSVSVSISLTLPSSVCRPQQRRGPVCTLHQASA